ncbi:MAG: lipid IV(A) 3-deoxy-D-manno-octulosonic acid transferase [Acidithiobacillus sp.]
MIRRLYAGLLCLLTPLVLGFTLWRAWRRPGYRERWWQRFGWIPRSRGPAPLWVHAVSVGEAIAAMPLIHALEERYPGHPILMSTTTPTGAAVVRARLGERVTHVYAPYDLPAAVARFFRRGRPALGIIMETEVWPNLYHAAARRAIPLYLFNARLSRRSQRGYQRFHRLVGPALQSLHAIAAQSDADAAAFRALGAAQVWATGNLKYDLPEQDATRAAGAALRQPWGDRPVWVFGSTHAGEDELAMAVLRTLRQQFPHLLLVLVPRHPERCGGVAALLQAQGLHAQRRSAGQPVRPEQEVLLVDTLGELPIFYAAADVVSIGGSFVPKGGHNPLEAAALAKPVSFGPHMENFRDIASTLLTAGAAVQTADGNALAVTLARWLADPVAAREESGQNGQRVVQTQRGALARSLALLPERL